LKERALQIGFSEEDLNFLKAYACGVYTNFGNYWGFGSNKLVPQLTKEKFDDLVRRIGTPRMKIIWTRIGNLVYDRNPPLNNLEFPDRGGVSSYYSYNVTSSDAELVKRFLISINQVDLHWNSRLWKVDDVLDVKIASNKGQWIPILGDYEFEGQKIRISNGDFHIFTQRIISHLSNALPYSANEHQERMIVDYIKHFSTGDIKDHKNSQRHWIKDKGPVVETNIGFIENYVDPMNIRSDFEGFVSIVDKIVSAKYSTLVSKAADIIPKLPWGKTFEKDQFTKPDFTSLTVLAFPGSLLPIGINIPNYDDIRQDEGFKNVNLGNAYPKINLKTLQFVSQEDAQMIEDLFHTAGELAVALHELLGHGSGKLLSRNASGQFNFDTEAINPATGEKIDCWYEGDETWSSKFGSISNPYEECRAETVAVYLSCFNESYEAFGITEDIERSRNMIWLNMALGGLKGLVLYNSEAGKWGQAHSWARYVIFRVMQEVEGLVQIEFTEDNQFILRMDYSKIPAEGFNAISRFLTKLSCFKSTGDIKRGTELFNHYSQMDDTILRVRQIVISNMKPRKANVQCHLAFTGSSPELINFEESMDGIIRSFQERFPTFDEEMFSLWEEEFSFNRH